MDQDIDTPVWLTQTVAAGRKAGAVLDTLEGLVRHQVIFRERGLPRVATVEAVAWDGEGVEVELRWRDRPDEASTETVTLQYPMELARREAWSVTLSAGQGGYCVLHFHPALVAQAQQLAGDRAGARALFELMQHPENLPPVPDGTVHPQPIQPQRPRIEVCCDAERLHIRVHGLPRPERGSLVWSFDRPAAALMAICQVCLPLAPDLMQHLLQQDRAHRQAHPEAWPALGVDADEVFAHRPELAMLYHLRFGGISVSGNLGVNQAIRLLQATGRHCGVEVIECTAPQAEGPSGRR